MAKSSGPDNALLVKIQELEKEIENYKSRNDFASNFDYYFNESADLICTANTDGYFLDVNKSLINTLGYSKVELLSQSFINFIHPEDIAKTNSELSNLKKGENTLSFSNRYITKNNEIIHLQWTSTLNTDTGKVFAIARNISALISTEEKLQTSEKLLNESQKMAKIGSWEFNLVTQELYWSNQLYKIFEIDKKSTQNLYEEYLSKFKEEDIALLQQKIESSIANKISYEIEHPIYLNKNVKWILGYGEPILDADNNVVKIRGIAQDITLKKESENAIKEKKYAELANKSKSEFLANMSHEIRTPLNGIIGFTDLLVDSELNTFQKVYMKNINQSANLLLEIVNDILDYSKIEAGKFKLANEVVNIEELSNQVVDLFNHSAVSKNLNLLLDFDTSLPKFIETDSLRIKQVLANLLSNAIKFTKKGNVTLSINGENHTANDFLKITFSVIDTGRGIKNENQNKIFESFEQENVYIDKKFGGTGLGLSISNSILKEFKSELKLKSEYKNGSTFSFDIICKVIKKPENTVSILKKESIDSFSEKEVSILIVEDNQINMLLIEKMIGKILGETNIIKAENGIIALKKLKKHTFDIILLDIQMPKMNGFETAKYIRENLNLTEVPIIAITAGVIDNDSQKYEEHKINDFLLKPYKSEQLQAIFKKHL